MAWAVIITGIFGLVDVGVFFLAFRGSGFHVVYLIGIVAGMILCLSSGLLAAKTPFAHVLQLIGWGAHLVSMMLLLRIALQFENTWGRVGRDEPAATLFDAQYVLPILLLGVAPAIIAAVASFRSKGH